MNLGKSAGIIEYKGCGPLPAAERRTLECMVAQFELVTTFGRANTFDGCLARRSYPTHALDEIEKQGSYSLLGG